jgi:hypothetical protein
MCYVFAQSTSKAKKTADNNREVCPCARDIMSVFKRRG